MIRTGRLMVTNSLADGIEIAPGDDGINQTVASAILEISLFKSLSQKIVRIVRQREIESKERTCDFSCLRGRPNLIFLITCEAG